MSESLETCKNRMPKSLYTYVAIGERSKYFKTIN